MQQKRICVCTQFVDTLYYLSAEIEGHDMTCQLLYGEMGAADRHHSLKVSSEGQKILVVTTEATEGVNLQKMTDLILYDIPISKTILQQLLSRFDRFGRDNQLHIYAFVPSNSSDSYIANSMALLRDLLADQAKPSPESLK
jgi:superfamily II DNA/RNA helicase